MRKSKIVYLDGSQERELIIPLELLFDSEKKEKFIKDHIGNVDYVERRYYDESDDDIDYLPEHDADNSDNNDNSENVSELPPSITEAPDSSVIDSEQPSIETLTAEIKMYLHIANQSIIEVGKRLIQAKELLPHGEWLNWLKNNFNLKQRMAYNFMEIAKRFGDSAKLQSIATFDISTFNTTQLIALLALPEGEEQNFLALKSAEGTPAEQMTIKQLRAEIKKFKDESELNLKKAGDLEDKLSANNIYVEELKSITDSLMNQNSNLKAQLEQRPTVTPPDYDDLKREVKELRERPVEVATEFPADYESTKQKLAKLETDADNFKRDTALKLSLQQFLKTIPELIAADNLQSVVNSCANDNLQDFESQLQQLHLIHSLLQQHLNTWKTDPVYKLPIDRDAIISAFQ